MSRLSHFPATLADTVIESERGFVLDLQNAQHVSFQVNATIVTTVANLDSATDVNSTTDTFTKTSHGYFTGLKGEFTTSDTLPTGISAATPYYIIVTGVNTFQIATSLSNALALVPLDFTSDGVGIQTFTPTAVSGASYKLQKSNDFTDGLSPSVNSGGVALFTGNWVDAVGSETYTAVSNSITATASSFASLHHAPYKYVRSLFSITTGSLKIKVIGQTK